MPKDKVIEVRHLSKSYTSRERPAGVKGLFKWGKKKTKVIFNNFNLSLDGQQIIGLIGPNGAGKSTLLKLLSGIIYPDQGEVKVLGYQPQKRQKSFLRQLGFLMGNKSHLWWNLPPIDSYQMLKAIYQIEENTFNDVLTKFSRFLEVDHLLLKPVRQLSLGERMRCQLIAAFLHQPKLVFLDEPTLALDIISQEKIRQFICYYQHEYQATVIVTSHYLKDILTTAQKVVILNNGQLVFQGDKDKLVSLTGHQREIKVEFFSPITREELQGYQLYLKKINDSQATFLVPKEKIVELTKFLTTNFSLVDLTIKEMEIETVIKEFFRREP